MRLGVRALILLVVLAACGSPVREASPAPTVAPPTSVAPASTAAAPPTSVVSVPPASVAPDVSWPAPPSPAAIGAGCTAGAPIAIGPAASALAIAATPGAAMLAMQREEQVTLQPLGTDGHAAGDAIVIDVPSLRTVHGLARLGEGLVLVVTTSCVAATWRQVCIAAQALDATGHARGTLVSEQVPAESFGQGAQLVAAPSGSAVWLASEFATSHSGTGIHASRIALGTSGAIEIRRASVLEGTLSGAYVASSRYATDGDTFAVLFGETGYGESDHELNARFLGRVAERATVVTPDDLGRVVHDLVVEGGRTHVLFDRGDDYFTAELDADGHVRALTPLDRSVPFPPPFGSRVLVESAGAVGHMQRVLHDASGRRLGEPLPDGPIAWTGAGFLVAQGAGGVTVTPLSCH